MSPTPPRIPFVPADIAEPAEVVAAIRARRGGELLTLDRMLLHSPALAAGWNTFLGAVRESLVVDRRLRELAMCTVAVLNGAEYEYTQHAPLYIAAGASAVTWTPRGINSSPSPIEKLVTNALVAA